MSATKTAKTSDDAQREDFDPATQRKARKVDPGKVKKDHLMAFLYYAKIDTTAPGGHSVQVTGLDNNQGKFGVHGEELIRNSFSADQFEEEEKVTKTRAAELLISSYNRPFTVCFLKQDKTERVLRGRLLAAEPLLGRSHVEDLDEPEGKRVRLVDHRTIQWLVVDGVKYVTPGK
jgi:hypothetical protein